MDYTQVLKWVATAAARGVIWVLAAWLGYTATQGDQTTIASALEGAGALALIVVSAYTSYKGRKTLLETKPK